MRKIDDGAYLDESGRLWIEADLPPDPFDPPGTPSRRGLKDSKFTYLDVPTFGLFGAFWKNNPLQFADEYSAMVMAEIISTLTGASVSRYVESVRVGPFSWRDKEMLSVTLNGKTTDVNAGLEASTYARAPQHYEAGLRDRLK